MGGPAPRRSQVAGDGAARRRFPVATYGLTLGYRAGKCTGHCASCASAETIPAPAASIMETPSGYGLNPTVVFGKPRQSITAAISAQKGCFALRELSRIS